MLTFIALFIHQKFALKNTNKCQECLSLFTLKCQVFHFPWSYCCHTTNWTGYKIIVQILFLSCQHLIYSSYKIVYLSIFGLVIPLNFPPHFPYYQRLFSRAVRKKKDSKELPSAKIYPNMGSCQPSGLHMYPLFNWDEKKSFSLWSAYSRQNLVYFHSEIGKG